MGKMALSYLVLALLWKDITQLQINNINTLAVSVLPPLAWISYESYFNSSDPHVISALWTWLAFVVIGMLLTPLDNPSRIAKLEIYQKFSINSVAVSILLLSVLAWIGYESYFSASEPWVILAFSTLLVFMVLMVICSLFIPLDNPSRTPSSSSSSVDSSDDLMLQILLRIPAKPLTNLKLVSKRWESLITTHHASFLRKQGSLGLICPGKRIHSFEFIPIDVQNPAQPPFSEINFPSGVSGGQHWIKESCNGLLLCFNGLLRNLRAARVWFPKLSCCVYNPTTKCFAQIPRPGGYPNTMRGLNLVFDPAKSAGYKVLFIYGVGALIQIEIYSSESGAWRLFGKPFSSRAVFNTGVYWNGSVHWVSRLSNELLYFNVDKEELRTVSLPPTLMPDDIFRNSKIGYFGESRDHLHVVEIHGMGVYDVHEMRKDYSGWYVRYRVDLSNTSDISHGYLIFSLVRGEEGKCQSFLLFMEATRSLVFKATGKFARWNLDSNTLEEIFVSENNVPEHRMIPYAFEYIQSLASI